MVGTLGSLPIQSIEGIYFDRSTSSSIVSAMLSPERVSWKEREQLLDEIGSLIIYGSGRSAATLLVTRMR